MHCHTHGTSTVPVALMDERADGRTGRRQPTVQTPKVLWEGRGELCVSARVEDSCSGSADQRLLKPEHPM